MIFRPESNLVYFNVDNVCDAILIRVRSEPTPPKLVVLDLSAAPMWTCKVLTPLLAWRLNSAP